MFRGQSVFLGAVICLVNVFVVAAILPDPLSSEQEPPVANETATTPVVESSSRVVKSDRPTLEFRRFVREHDAVAEFCFTNRSDRTIFLHRADLWPYSDEVKAAGVWYFNGAALDCGVGVLGRRPERVEPGNSFCVYGYVCPCLREYVLVASKLGDVATIEIPEAEEIRKVVYYSTTLGGPTTAVRSEPVDIRAKWRELAARHEAKGR